MAPSLFLSLCVLLLTPGEGQLVIAGGNLTNTVVYSKFIELAGKEPKVAIITTASPSSRVRSMDFWKSFSGKVAKLTEVCKGDPFPEGVDAIWMAGGDQALLEREYIGKPFEGQLIDFYKRGGILGGTSAGAAFMSKVMIRDDGPVIGVGLDLLPNCIIDQHFTARNRLTRLKIAVNRHPKLTGVGIDENTAIVYSKGVMRIIGEANVTILQNGEVVQLKEGESLKYAEQPERRLAVTKTGQ